jgi:putative chitinase
MELSTVKEKLLGVIPNPVINELDIIFDKYKINTILRISHFLAQCAHESGNFSVKQENLNYSAKRLQEVFGKYFTTHAKALLYERKPVKIASLVYGNRMGNGDEQSVEGYKYRGRGYIQLTGKNNYLLFDKSLNESGLEVDIIGNPDLVATTYPLISAAWFFNKNNLNEIADLGGTKEIITRVTKKVNGGTHGLDSRISYFNKFCVFHLYY